jgi:hypothetical protein
MHLISMNRSLIRLLKQDIRSMDRTGLRLRIVVWRESAFRVVINMRGSKKIT